MVVGNNKTISNDQLNDVASLRAKIVATRWWDVIGTYYCGIPSQWESYFMEGLCWPCKWGLCYGDLNFINVVRYWWWSRWFGKRVWRCTTEEGMQVSNCFKLVGSICVVVLDSPFELVGSLYNLIGVHSGGTGRELFRNSKVSVMHTAPAMVTTLIQR